MSTKDIFDARKLEDIAIEAIQYHEQLTKGEGYHLAFSGGKDSIVLKHLAMRSGVKFKCHYQVSTIDPPALVYYIRENHPDVIWHHPKKSMLVRMVEKGSPPLRHQRWCCEEYKEGNAYAPIIMTGIRWEESLRRSKRRPFEVCTKDKTKHFLHPIINWHTDDIWRYINNHKLPYCNLYDKGWKRIGCLMCPMASSWARKRDAKEYPNYVKLYKKYFQKMKDGRSIKGKVDGDIYKGTGEQIFDWWINDIPSIDAQEGQCLLFDN